MLSLLAVGFDLLPLCYDAGEPRLSVGPLLFIVGPGMVQVNSEWPALNGGGARQWCDRPVRYLVRQTDWGDCRVGSPGGRTLDLWLLGRW